LRRKVLPGKNPDCICGHTRDCHWKYCSTTKNAEWGSCKDDTQSTNRQNFIYCACTKFVDKRHYKISKYDLILSYLVDHKKFAYTQADLTNRTGASRPTVSRRKDRFLSMHLIDAHGHAWDGNMWVEQYSINIKRYLKLVEEGVIVDG